MFWVLLAVVAFTYLVTPLLTPKSKAPDPNLGQVSPPTATKGIPIPVVFGTQKVAPNVTWFGHVYTEPVRTVTGNRTLLNPFAANHSTVTGYKYGADIAGVFCHGPIDSLVDIQFDTFSMNAYDHTASGTNPGFAGGIAPPVGNGPQVITFTAGDLFGGDEKDGGVVGSLEFWFGKLTQNASAKLATSIGSAVSNYKGLVHFVWTATTFGTSPYIKPFYAVVRRCPMLVSPDAATANIGGSANLADCIYEILTDARWGLGQAPSMIDFDSFRAAAVTLKAEGLGVDFTMAQQESGEETIGELLRHGDAVLFTHPLTGKLTLKLARADYAVEDLPVLDASNISQVSNYKRNTWPETFNEVITNFVDRGTGYGLTFLQDSVKAQNLASMQAMGQVAQTEIDFPYISNAALALKLAFRELRPLSVPLASATVVVNRTAHAATVGSCVVWNWAELGIAGLVMRVATVKASTLEDNSIELGLIEDVFAAAPAVFSAPSGTSWIAPTLTPIAPLAAVAVPAPYWLVKSDAFVGVNLVVRGSKAATTYDGYFDLPSVADGSPGPQRTTDDPFVSGGALVSALRWSAPYQIEAADLTGNGLILSNVQDMESVTGTNAAGLTTGERLALIYGAPDDAREIVAYRDVVANGDGTYSLYGVMRGQFDTLPIDHPAASLVLFIPSADAVGKYWPGFPGTAAPAASAQTASSSGYKGWAASKGIRGTRAPEPPTFTIAQTGKPLTDPRRAVMPYPPGKLTMNGTAANVINTATPVALNTITITWVGRNRLTEAATRLHSAAGVAEEAGVTYEVMVLWVNRATGATIFTLRTATATTTPFAYSNNTLEVELKAANGGVVPGPTDPNRTNGGLRFLFRAKVSATLFSEWVAVPGFKGAQSVGFPVVPSLVFQNQGAILTLEDVTDLQGWYAADNGQNITSGAQPTERIDWMYDQSVNARNLVRSAGTVQKLLSALNGLPAFDMIGGYFSNLTIPLKGSATFFAVIRYDALGVYHTFFDTQSTGATPMILWFDSANLIEPNASSNTAQKPAKSLQWGVLVIHNFNTGGKLGYKLRWNGLQIATETALVAAGTIPGTVGVPANQAMSIFNRSGASVLRGRVAEWGFYGISKDGTEKQLEAYLLDKYGFAELTDTTDLSFWISAENLNNVVDGATQNLISATDKSGNGRDVTPAGTVRKVANTANGRAVLDFNAVAGNNYLSSINVPTKSGFTLFAVLKYAATGTDQMILDNVPTDTPPVTARALAAGGIGAAAGTAVVTSWAGSFITLVVHFANTGSPQITAKVRVNGTQRGTFANSAAGATIPGTPSVPVALVFDLFRRATGGLYYFKGQLAEMGVYAISKDGTEATLESYLQTKYRTW